MQGERTWKFGTKQNQGKTLIRMDKNGSPLVKPNIEKMGQM